MVILSAHLHCGYCWARFQVRGASLTTYSLRILRAQLSRELKSWASGTGCSSLQIFINVNTSSTKTTRPSVKRKKSQLTALSWQLCPNMRGFMLSRLSEDAAAFMQEKVDEVLCRWVQQVACCMLNTGTALLLKK